MTITTSQLDELERRATSLRGHGLEVYSEDICQLVAIARAALALVGPAQVSHSQLQEFNDLIRAVKGTP